MKKKIIIVLAVVALAAVIMNIFIALGGKDEVTMSKSNEKILSALIPASDELKDISPESYDMKLAKEKELTDKEEITDKYLKLQALYKKTLGELLVAVLELDSFDNELASNELEFIEVPDKEKGFYQKYDTLGLKYIYLRNNIHIEKLSIEDVKILKSALASEDNTAQEQLYKMIARTYPEVIKITFTNPEDADFDVVYEPGAFGTKKAPNTALVLAISTSYQYDASGNVVDMKAEQTKEAYVSELRERMITEISKKIDIPVTVFLYN